MQIISIIVLLLFVALVKKKNFGNPMVVMTAVWVPVLLLPSVLDLGITTPSQYAYFIIFLGLFFFSFGFFVKSSGGKRNNAIVDNSKDFRINYGLLIVFEIISLLVLLPQVVTSISYMITRGYGLGHIHTLFTSGNVAYQENRSFDIFFYLFVYPTLFSATLLGSYDFWFGKRNVPFQLFSFLLIVFRVLQYGGRNIIFCFVLAYSFGGILFFTSKAITKQQKKKALAIAIVPMVFAFLFLVYSVLSRISDRADGLKRFISVYYLSGPSIMTQKIENVETGFFTLGFSTFYGLYKTLYKFAATFFKLIGISYDGSTFYGLLEYHAYFMEQPVDIGISNANAFVTSFYYFYIDGGLIGVILLSFLWGYFSGKYYYGYKAKPGLKNYYFLVFTLVLITLSMTKSLTSTPQVALAILYFFVFCRREAKCVYRKTMPSRRMKIVNI